MNSIDLEAIERAWSEDLERGRPLTWAVKPRPAKSYIVIFGCRFYGRDIDADGRVVWEDKSK